MKRLFVSFALLISVFSISYAATGENLSMYQIKEYATVEEFKDAYLNKVITYAPVEKYIELLRKNSLSQQMDLGFRFRDFVVTNITGKTKKGKDTQDMEWTIKEVNGPSTRTFKVHSGNYKKEISYYSSDTEFLF